MAPGDSEGDNDTFRSDFQVIIDRVKRSIRGFNVLQPDRRG